MARDGSGHDASHAAIAAIAFIHVYFHPTNPTGLLGAF